MQEEHEPCQGMVAGPTVLGHAIHSDERQRAWLVDGQFLVRCSSLEYQILALFFRQANNMVTYTDLYHVYHPEHVARWREVFLAKPRFRSLISRMRPKLWPCHLDVVSIVGIGYLLISSDFSLEGEALQKGEERKGTLSPS